jgi:hypothetical protein|tara:strand:+ start:2056 stop:3993 length:1938 start_codon:yes stop_codon:yes gene_type:complete
MDEEKYKLLLERYNTDNDLSIFEKRQLAGFVQSDINNMMENDPSFNKQLFKQAKDNVMKGTDFYYQTSVKTDAQKKELNRSTLGQRADDIITKEDITSIESGTPSYLYKKGSIYQGEKVDEITDQYQGRKSGMGVTSYKTSGETNQRTGYGKVDLDLTELTEDQMINMAYADKGSFHDATFIGVAGCGDNMTCIGSQTHTVLDAIDAWNNVDGNPKVNLPNDKVISSHDRFWRDSYSGNEAEYGEYGKKKDERNFVTTHHNLVDMYENGDTRKGKLIPTALADMLADLQPGDMMGIGGGSTPSHAIMYAGGVRHRTDKSDAYGDPIYESFDFNTEDGYKAGLAYLEEQSSTERGLSLSDFDFLNMQDHTENAPWQFETYGLGAMFGASGGPEVTDTYNNDDPSDDYTYSSSRTYVSSFDGNKAYDTWYNNTYTQPLADKNELLTSLSNEAYISQSSNTWKGVETKSNVWNQVKDIETPLSISEDERKKDKKTPGGRDIHESWDRHDTPTPPQTTGNESEHNSNIFNSMREGIRNIFGGGNDERKAGGAINYNVGESNIEGEGLFASKDIGTGERIGTAIYNKGGLTRTEIGKKVNHRFQDNASLDYEGGGRYGLYSTKKINKGGEITSNYKATPEFIDKNTSGYV